MDEKQRFTRAQWIKDASIKGAENNPAPWAGLPEENSAAPWTGLSAGNNLASWLGHPARNDFTSWTECPTENDPASWAESPMEEAEVSEEEAFTGEEVPYDYIYEGDEGEEDAELLEQPLPLEEERHPLLNALMILVALYIICGLAPLFVALFVSLRIFFWLEIGGSVIILGWLLIGVRPPLMVWIKEKLKERKEQISEQQEQGDL